MNGKLAILILTLSSVCTNCAADDPLSIAEESEPQWQSTSTSSRMPSYEPLRARQVETLTSLEPDYVVSSESTTTTPTTVPPTTVPSPTTTSSPAQFDDVPASVLAAVQNLWPENEWNRALTVARCESNYRVDAANPTSSARGVFQLLAAWRRDPGSGRTVWGWDYTLAGEKLSAAAGLGISEADATSTIANVTVAHLIWERSGWSPWNASRHCWAGS